MANLIIQAQKLPVENVFYLGNGTHHHPSLQNCTMQTNFEKKKKKITITKKGVKILHRTISQNFTG